jgi:DNA-binding MarR family transcriptional regulator
MSSNPIDQSDLAALVGEHLKRAYAAACASFDSEVGKLGLARAEFAVLSIVRGNPGINIKQLASALAIAPPNLGRMLDRLEARRLVARRRSGDDRRVQRIELTEDGVRLRSRSAKAARDADTAATRRLSSEECDLLKDLLRKIG